MKHPSGDDHSDGGAAPRASAGEGAGAGGDTLRIDPPPVPRGRDRLRWYGPGLLWMLSSVGSGSVLFTPRIGSRYGYELLWIALVVIFLQWMSGALLFAGLFFSAFALLYFGDLLGLLSLGRPEAR